MTTHSIIRLAPNQFNVLQYDGTLKGIDISMDMPEELTAFQTPKSAVFRHPFRIDWKNTLSFGMQMAMLRSVFEFANFGAFCDAVGLSQATAKYDVDKDLLPEYHGRKYLDLRTQAPELVAASLELARLREYLAPQQRPKGIASGAREYREDRERRLHNRIRAIAHELRNAMEKSEKRLDFYLSQRRLLPVIKDREKIEERLCETHGITERYPIGYFSFVPLTHFTPPSGVELRDVNGCHGIALLDLKDPELYRRILRGTPVTPMYPACMRGT